MLDGNPDLVAHPKAWRGDLSNNHIAAGQPIHIPGKDVRIRKVLLTDHRDMFGQDFSVRAEQANKSEVAGGVISAAPDGPGEVDPQ